MFVEFSERRKGVKEGKREKRHLFCEGWLCACGVGAGRVRPWPREQHVWPSWSGGACPECGPGSCPRCCGEWDTVCTRSYRGGSAWNTGPSLGLSSPEPVAGDALAGRWLRSAPTRRLRSRASIPILDPSPTPLTNDNYRHTCFWGSLLFCSLPFGLLGSWAILSRLAHSSFQFSYSLTGCIFIYYTQVCIIFYFYVFVTIWF